MKKSSERLSYLISRYFDQAITGTEEQELWAYVDDPAYAKQIEYFLPDAFDWLAEAPAEGLDSEHRQAILVNIFNQKKVHIRHIRLWPRIAAAACLLIGLSVGGYFYLHKTPNQENTQFAKNDIKPGHNQATLTLANGQKIILTKGLSGQLAVQNKTVISASQNTITYNAAQSGDQFSYNTLTTARGEQSPYPLVLADGTKVWLNAESSIIFPTAFNGKERLVKITGEAYFEVVHNAAQPFKIAVNGQTVEDIGTAFNINSYPDETVMKTTVLEGSVKVSKATAFAILKQGQQAVSQPDNNLIKVKDADLDGTMAWKNGFSHFDRADIKTVMRTLARWYDVEVVYEGDIPKREFSGDIPLNLKASQALKVLELLKIDFKIAGKKIIVTKQKI
jgi:transmembrane sensor